MDIHKKVELERATGKVTAKPSCRICRLIRVYLLFAIPTLALFWLGVDFGVGDIDAQESFSSQLRRIYLVVKLVLLVQLFFSIIRRIYLDFFRGD